MSVTVYHWPYQFNVNNVSVGHIAIEVNSNLGRRYLSWYPNESKTPSALIATTPRNNSYMDDIRHNGPAPEIIIIDGLDEAKMIDFINKPKSAYSLFGTSCAQVVADALRAGIGGKYAAGIMNFNPIWTPQTAADFARRIRRGGFGNN